jgi:phosphinothricin acetyltransferase
MTQVRPARHDDLPDIVAIYNHAVEHSHATFDTETAKVEARLAWFAGYAACGPHRLLVAIRDGHVAGWTSSSAHRAHPAFAHTVELSVYLDPRHRGVGVASALYRHLLGELSAEDVHLAVAGIGLPNDASIALHRKLGFTEVGVFEEYAIKHGAYISSLWMQRRIG